MKYQGILTKQLWLLPLITLLLSMGTSCEKKKDGPFVEKWGVTLDVSNDEATFTDVEFVDENRGYAVLAGDVGFRHTLWQTSDGGKTWAANSFSLEQDYILHISLVDEMLFGCGIGAYQLNINDLEWTNIYPSHHAGRMGDIHFFSKRMGIIANCNRIMSTQNGGNSWEEVFSTDFMACYNKLFFTANKTGYAIGGSTHDNANFGFIAKTVDEGQTWNLLNTNFTNITDCYFLDDKTGFIFTFNRELFNTTDGGATWQLVNGNTGEPYARGFFLTEKEGYFGGRDGIYHTFDGGHTWQKEFSTQAGEVIREITFKGKTGVAVTNKGRIISIIN